MTTNKVLVNVLTIGGDKYNFNVFYYFLFGPLFILFKQNS